ncbi:hypothetical protein MKJ04_07355 [Pontibacter sp. E15-1]|uniref:hypothetical protein n=1 Tax=Pontibacter sp. E15-1 TaxID=2919918 RepID=UPI001F4F1C8C|nr:hypothetical protein [Pontibacter sp. E15-1]MCJ8164658.1 hypothetical protein [Pontibacter sp. E15-1]
MTQNTRYYSLCLLMLHAALLMFLSFYFLAREEYLMHTMRHRLPLQFLIRFGAFWFVSLLFTLSFFMFYTHRYKVQLPLARYYTVFTGRLAFGAGILILFFVALYVVFLRDGLYFY